MHALVLTTAPNAETVERITARLLDLRLVACANSFSVSSTFRWKGKVERADEMMVFYKARAEDFAEIRTEIEKLHPYETPCIELVEIEDANSPCLEWIKDSTERHRAGSSRR